MQDLCPVPRSNQSLVLLLSAGLLLLTLLCGAFGAQAGEEPPPEILASFATFSKGWMARLDEVSLQNSRSAKAEKGNNGRVFGRYLCYGPECRQEVRATGSKATPYVGILRYVQREMEKEGDSPQQMRARPGVATGETQVTEIFRYTGGRWVY